MNSFQKLHSHIKAMIITIGAFGISWFTSYDLSSISFFAPMEKVNDFKFSDFYMAVADNRDVRILDSDIIIVSVDGCDRRKIARAITDIDSCRPAIIGLDVAFGKPRENADDKDLLAALSNTPNIVFPVLVDDLTEEIIHVMQQSILKEWIQTAPQLENFVPDLVRLRQLHQSLREKPILTRRCQ